MLAMGTGVAEVVVAAVLSFLLGCLVGSRYAYRQCVRMLDEALPLTKDGDAAKRKERG